MRFVLIDLDSDQLLWVVAANRVTHSWCVANQGRQIIMRGWLPDAVATDSAPASVDDTVMDLRFSIKFEPCNKGREVHFWLAYIYLEKIRSITADYLLSKGQQGALDAALLEKIWAPSPQMIEIVNHAIQHAEYE